MTLHRHILSIITLALVVATTAPTEAESVHPIDLDGETVNFVVPEGYCALDLDRQDDREWFDSFVDGMKPKARPLLIFVWCNPQEGPANAPASPEAYGFYSALLDPSGKFETWLKPRRWYAESIGENAEIDNNLIEDMVRERMQTTLSDPDASIEIEELHITGYDYNAVYGFVLGERTIYGESLAAMGTFALTVVNGRKITVALSDLSIDPALVDKMNRNIRSLLWRLLDANPDSDN